jgi:predicted transcriptional regulator
VAYLNKRHEAQVLLSQDISQSRVAELLKISRKTIGRWLKEPGFKEGIVSGRKAQLEAALVRNTPLEDVSKVVDTRSQTSLSERLISKCFAALDEVLSNPEARTSDRLKAAQIILSQCGGGAVANFGLKQTEQRPQNNVDTLIAQRENLRARMKTLESRRDLKNSVETS